MPPKKDTKTRILDSALQLFSERGFKATTTRLIAENAGINEVTLFRYFGSKEKLFLAVIEQETKMRMGIVQIEPEPSENMVDELTMDGNMITKSMLERASFFRLMVLEMDRYPEIWEHMAAVPQTAISQLSNYFNRAKENGFVRADVDSEEMAITFFSYLFRILVANALLGSDFFVKNKRDDGMKQFVEIFVNGIRPRGDE